MASLVTKVEFSLQKTPAKNISVDIPKMIITWEPGKRSYITATEESVFMKETWELLEILGEFYIQAVEKNPVQMNFSYVKNILINYWDKWGPLHPLSHKIKKLDLSNLFFMGFAFVIMQKFWTDLTNPLIMQLIDSFFEVASEHHKINKKSHGRREWKLWYFDISTSGKFNWLPLNTQNFLDVIHPYIKLPSTHELENILTFGYEAKEKWIKESVLQNIADYVSAQKLTFKAAINGAEMYLTSTANNLYVAFLINLFFGLGASKIKYCECGCGVPLTKGQRRFATKPCRYRLREKDDLQKLTSWLRVNKNRGKFTEARYKDLCREAESLYEQDFSYKEIQNELKMNFYHFGIDSL